MTELRVVAGIGLCALVLAGALAACAAPGTPVPAATLTLIPATATHTPLPPSPSPQPSATDTLIVPTASPTPAQRIETILASSVTPDASLTQRILRDYAQALGIDERHIQIVRIEAATWIDDSLGCTALVDLPNAPAASTPFPLQAVDGLRYVLLVGDSVAEYHTAGRDFVRCPHTERIADELLLAVDAVAADMFRLAQRRVADMLDLPTRRVQLVSIRTYRWEDTSLGCPLPEQQYSDATIDGYRMVLQAGSAQYAFHSDSVSIIPCEAGREVLP